MTDTATADATGTTEHRTAPTDPDARLQIAVAQAALSVEGVHRLGTPAGRLLASARAATIGGSSATGVRLTEEDGRRALQVTIVVSYPRNVREVAGEVRRKVEQAAQAGRIASVEVVVSDVHGPFDRQEEKQSPDDVQPRDGAVQKAGDAAQQAAATARERAGDARDAAQKAAKDAGQRASEARDAAGAKAQEVRETAGEKAQEAKQAVSEAADAAGARASEAWTAAGEAVDDAAKAVDDSSRRTAAARAEASRSAAEAAESGVEPADATVVDAGDGADPVVVVVADASAPVIVTTSGDDRVVVQDQGAAAADGAPSVDRTPDAAAKTGKPASRKDAPRA